MNDHDLSICCYCYDCYDDYYYDDLYSLLISMKNVFFFVNSLFCSLILTAMIYNDSYYSLILIFLNHLICSLILIWFSIVLFCFLFCSFTGFCNVFLWKCMKNDIIKYFFYLFLPEWLSLDFFEFIFIYFSIIFKKFDSKQKNNKTILKINIFFLVLTICQI